MYKKIVVIEIEIVIEIKIIIKENDPRSWAFCDILKVSFLAMN